MQFGKILDSHGPQSIQNERDRHTYSFVRISMLHGLQDDIVPVEGCVRFAVKARDAMKGRPGGDKIVFTTREGGHGFDGLSRLEEPWLLDNLRLAVEAWLEYPVTAYRWKHNP